MSDLHRSKPPPTVNYRHTMPEIDRLMQVHKSCMVHGIGISKKAMDCTTYICTCANCVEEFFTGNSLPLAYCLQCPLKNIWLIFRIEYLMQKIALWLQEWPPEVEEILKEISLPNGDYMTIEEFIDTISQILDIPLHRYTQSPDHRPRKEGKLPPNHG